MERSGEICSFFPSRNHSNLSHPSPLVIPTVVEGSALRPAALSNPSWEETRNLRCSSSAMSRIRLFLYPLYRHSRAFADDSYVLASPWLYRDAACDERVG